MGFLQKLILFALLLAIFPGIFFAPATFSDEGITEIVGSIGEMDRVKLQALIEGLEKDGKITGEDAQKAKTELAKVSNQDINNANAKSKASMQQYRKEKEQKRQVSEGGNHPNAANTSTADGGSLSLGLDD